MLHQQMQTPARTRAMTQATTRSTDTLHTSQHSGNDGGGGNMDDVLKRLSNVESSLIRWLVGTLLAVAVLTFTIARFVKVGG